MIKVEIDDRTYDAPVPMKLSDLKICADAIRRVGEISEKAIDEAKVRAAAEGRTDLSSEELASYVRMDLIEMTTLSVRIVSAALLRTNSHLTPSFIEDHLKPDQYVPLWASATAIRSASMPRAKDARNDARPGEDAPAAAPAT